MIELLEFLELGHLVRYGPAGLDEVAAWDDMLRFEPPGVPGRRA